MMFTYWPCLCPASRDLLAALDQACHHVSPLYFPQLLISEELVEAFIKAHNDFVIVARIIGNDGLSGVYEGGVGRSIETKADGGVYAAPFPCLQSHPP